jgi:uncharacterized circularly permuted ATP-grasp superfamily protein/uncharacterized alpha-E superfamily protein
MTTELYHPPLEHREPYNESLEEDGSFRPHWAPLLQTLEKIGTAELTRRWGRAERRIRENGITYNIYGDPEGVNRPWKIDMIPLVIPAREWREIEAGLVQRASLLSEILEDVYGEQRLISGGLVPAELLFANPAFLRPLCGAPVPLASYLHMLAVDLARSPDGQWWVLADRTQAPSGSGYALENRTIVSNVLPDIFRSSKVQRLAQFFRAEREALSALSAVADPRIVLLTPGPHNETYFEHSYIARYLGFTLVEGADLTVRDRMVYLKTVTGLEKVDVILRRVDDSFCDPLELRGDSLLGVPGLVDAVVAGNVRVANALGSGVIESASILPFLPGLCTTLRGERLLLPSVATWWCGQPYAMDWVLNHLDSVVIKPAFPSRPMEPVFAAELEDKHKHSLAARIKAHPHDYVAQEQVALSHVPVWEHGALDARSLVLRAYVLNTGRGWTVMPGGLVRVAAEGGSVVSMQRGGHSKDAWVLSDGPVDTFSMLRPRNAPVDVRREDSALPSSVALNVYWLGRYVERAEGTTRVLRTIVARFPHASWNDLHCLLRLHLSLRLDRNKLPRNRNARSLPLRFQKELISVLSDAKRNDGLAYSLVNAFETGSKVRERLSLDMMHLLGKMSECFPAARTSLLDYPALLSNCMELISAFSGMERENISRGTGWLFLSIGRRLERALFITRQLRQIARPFKEIDWPLLELMLEVADSSMTYRSRYYTTLQPVPVLEVLMKDRANPRSLDFQLDHLLELYEKLPRHRGEDLEAIRSAVQRLRAYDLSAIRYPLPDEEDSAAKRVGVDRLRKYFDELETMLIAWARNLSSLYFDHVRKLAVNIGDSCIK